MHPRYETPDITELWSPRWTYRAWHTIELSVLANQRMLGTLDADRTAPLFESMVLRAPEFNEASVQAIADIEIRTKHDVAAFLEFIREYHGPGSELIHFGLTSSDIVDTAQGMRFHHLRSLIQDQVSALLSALTEWTTDDTIVVGRTHGQPGEPTSVRIRAMHWLAELERPIQAVMAMTGEMKIAKLSGPMGTFAHNSPELERRVARELRLREMGPGASQIVPRSTLGLWASAAGSLAASCAKIAMDLRLMNLLGETENRHTPGQVGSSSMAHKNNPIVAEQIAGLARMAAGYAQMLQPLDLWLERDISHSSVERVAVPDLCHTLMQVLRQTTALLHGTMLDELGIESNLADNGEELQISRATNQYLLDGDGIAEARAKAVAMVVGLHGISSAGARWFTRNYPGSLQ